jgi:hypothetical protein
VTSGQRYQHDGDVLAIEYLDRVIRDGLDAAELTATGDVSPDLFEYPGRLMPNPVFVSAQDSMLLARQLQDIHDLLISLPQRRFGGNPTEYARMLGLSEFQIAVVERARPEQPPLLARADLYRTATGFALLEMNLGSSLGGFQCAEINRAMVSHPCLASFVADKQLSWVDTSERLLGTALALHAERSSSVPTVALVDWPDTFPLHEPRIEVMARLCRRSGIETVVCHLGELREEPAGLTYRGRHIDIVYRFFLLEYVTSTAGVELLQPLLRAERSGAVTLLSPMDADMYGFKEGLALLSEMVHAEDLDDTERDSVASLIPWTRRLRSTIDDPAGEAVDTLRYALAQQSELILKPVSLHGGTGIVAGWAVDTDRWRQCIEDSLDGPYILQQRVHPVPDPVLIKQAIGRMYCNWGVFLTPSPTTGAACYSGCFIRASADPEVDVISYDAGALLGACMTMP